MLLLYTLILFLSKRGRQMGAAPAMIELFPPQRGHKKNIINMGNGLLGRAQNKTACRILQQTKHSTNT